MKKTIITLFILSILLTTGISKTLLNHDIIVDVSKQGTATITERFVYGLQGEEVKQFNNLSITRTNDLKAWHEFDNNINQYVVGNTSGIKISTTTINQGQFGYEIKLEYSIEQFAKKINTQGRYETYEINGNSFLMQEGQVFSLPKNTDLTISLDTSINPEDIIEIIPTPWTIINKQSFKWISGTYSDTFLIKYKVETSISEGLTPKSILNFFIKKPVYSASILVIILLTIIYRKQLTELISESFIGEEETIIMPKRRKK